VTGGREPFSRPVKPVKNPLSAEAAPLCLPLEPKKLGGIGWRPRVGEFRNRWTK
jgi:hypothetical protein